MNGPLSPSPDFFPKTASTATKLPSRCLPRRSTSLTSLSSSLGLLPPETLADASSCLFSFHEKLRDDREDVQARLPSILLNPASRLSRFSSSSPSSLSWEQCSISKEGNEEEFKNMNIEELKSLMNKEEAENKENYRFIQEEEFDSNNVGEGSTIWQSNGSLKTNQSTYFKTHTSTLGKSDPFVASSSERNDPKRPQFGFEVVKSPQIVPHPLLDSISPSISRKLSFNESGEDMMKRLEQVVRNQFKDNDGRLDITVISDLISKTDQNDLNNWIQVFLNESQSEDSLSLPLNLPSFLDLSNFVDKPRRKSTSTPRHSSPIKSALPNNSKKTGKRGSSVMKELTSSFLNIDDDNNDDDNDDLKSQSRTSPENRKQTSTENSGRSSASSLRHSSPIKTSSSSWKQKIAVLTKEIDFGVIAGGCLDIKELQISSLKDGMEADDVEIQMKIESENNRCPVSFLIDDDQKSKVVKRTMTSQNRSLIFHVILDVPETHVDYEKLQATIVVQCGSIIVDRISVSAVLGYAKLKVMKGIQTFRAPPHNVITRELPITNVGNVRMRLGISLPSDCQSGSLEVSNEILEIEPYTESKLSLSFKTRDQVIEEQVDLQVQILPHGIIYKIPLLLKVEPTNQIEHSAEFHPTEFPVEANRSKVVFCRQNERQDVALRNITNNTVDLYLSIRDSPAFYLSDDYDSSSMERKIILPPKSTKRIEVAISRHLLPETEYSGKLILKPGKMHHPVKATISLYARIDNDDNKNKKRTLYLDKDTLSFPATKIGEYSILKVMIKNRTDVIRHCLIIDGPEPPFFTTYTEVSVKPSSYLGFPVKFRPETPGIFKRKITLCNEGRTLKVTLIGRAL